MVRSAVQTGTGSDEGCAGALADGDVYREMMS